MIPLAEVLQDYFLLRHLAARSQNEMDRITRHFADWLQRDATTADLTDRRVSEWILALESRYEPRGVSNHRTGILCLWRFAAQQHQIPAPLRVRQATRPQPCPMAWTFDELTTLLNHCANLRGIFGRTHALRSTYSCTLIRFAYETGLRRSDIWSVRRDQIRPDGTIVLRQHKTGFAHWPRIRPATLEGLRALPGPKPLACPYASESDFYKWWRLNVIEPTGVRPGVLQQLRRTGATQLAVDHPEAVQRYLGHRTTTMQRHYVDQSIAEPVQYLPKPLPPPRRVA